MRARQKITAFPMRKSVKWAVGQLSRGILNTSTISTHCFPLLNRREMIKETSNPKDSEVHGDKKGRGLYFLRVLTPCRRWHWGPWWAELLEISMAIGCVSFTDKASEERLTSLWIILASSSISFKVLTITASPRFVKRCVQLMLDSIYLWHIDKTQIWKSYKTQCPKWHLYKCVYLLGYEQPFPGDF